MTSADDAAYAVWTDTRSGTNEDIYVSRYTPGEVPTATPGSPTVTPTVTHTATDTYPYQRT